MIELLFDRHSKVVLGIALLSVYLGYLNTYHINRYPMATTIALSWSTLLYGFAIFCRCYPWYALADRGHGIEEHFIKIFITSAYLYTIGSAVFHVTGSLIPLIAMGILLIIPTATNVAVLIYHFQDNSTIAPSYYSRSLYEKNG